MAALLLLRVAVGFFSVRDVTDAIEGGDSGWYEESEVAGERLFTEVLSLAGGLLAMAAGGSEKALSTWPVRLALLPGSISVEGCGVGRPAEGMAWEDITEKRDIL